MEDPPTILFQSNSFFPAHLVPVQEQSFEIQDIKDNYDLTHHLIHNKSSKNNQIKNEGNKKQIIKEDILKTIEDQDYSPINYLVAGILLVVMIVVFIKIKVGSVKKAQPIQNSFTPVELHQQENQGFLQFQSQD